MKKTLLLSVVASTMIMAGGDIAAPVEPVVEAPAVVEEVSAWKFNGQAVAFTQTVDSNGDASLFGSDTTYGALGVQLGAVNKDLIGGLGAGVEVAAIRSSTGSFGSGFYGTGGNAGTTSGGFTQAYLTYGFGGTSLKVGRQTLPKSLSPFAYSEGWQVFKNTFDAALVVNSSIPNTTVVYAYVTGANRSVGGYLDAGVYNDVAGGAAVDGAHMIAVQNKSIDGLTLTGNYYFAGNMDGLGDTSIVWGDAKFKAGAFNVAVQGGQVSPDLADSTSAFGVKVGGKFGMFTASAAYTSVGDGTVGITNLGTGIKSPLYTQMVLNNVGQYHAAPGSDFLKVGGTVKALGGTIKAFYGAGTNDSVAAKGDYTEFDLMYVTKLTDNLKVFGAYVYTDDSNVGNGPDANNFVRVWARYSF